MQILYGFIYYFTLVMTGCCLSLSIFLLKPMRRLLVKFWRAYTHILEHDAVKLIKTLSFSLIGLVLAQSAYILFVLEAHFSTSKQPSTQEARDS